MRRLAAITVLVLGVLFAAWRLWPRKQEGDEAQIRRMVALMAQKAGERDVNGVLEHVSESYQGEGGDKRELKRYLLGYLLSSGAVAVIPANLQLEGPIEAGKARISLVALLSRTPADKTESLHPDQLVGAHRIDAELQKEGGAEWRVATATRRPASPEDWLR